MSYFYEKSESEYFIDPLWKWCKSITKSFCDSQLSLFLFFLSFCTIFPAQRWKQTSSPFFHFNVYPENCCSLDISSFSWSFPVNRSDGCAGKSQQKSLKSPFCLTFMLILNFSTMTAVFTWMHRVEQVCLITSNIVQKRQKTKPNCPPPGKTCTLCFVKLQAALDLFENPPTKKSRKLQPWL